VVENTASNPKIVGLNPADTGKEKVDKKLFYQLKIWSNSNIFWFIGIRIQLV
jgi:hypothetical protein